MTDVEAAAVLLRTLIEIPSVNPAYDPGSEGEGRLARWLGEYCSATGLDVELDEVAPGRPNVIATLRGPAPERTLLIEAHSDTVGLPPGQAAPRAERRGTVMAGRGACDTKGGLAATLLALRDLAEHDRPVRTAVCLLGAADEEHRYRGIVHHLQRRPRPDAAVVVEPTELRPAAQHAGVLRLRIAVEGRAAHSSRPEKGRNAIVDAYRVIDRLRSWNDTPRGTGPAQLLSVTRISGGTAVNVVPASCWFDLDIRTRPGDDPLAVEEEIGRLLAALDADGVRAAVAERMVADQGLDTSPDAAVVRAASAACAAEGLPDSPVHLGFGSDASKLGRAGVPVVVFGPGSIRQAHADDEWVDLTDVVRAARVLAGLVRAYDAERGT